MSEWQPIDTAPKDGTWILAICDDFDHPVVCRFKRFTRLNGNVIEYWGLSYMSYYDEITCTPIQWIPIPPLDENHCKD